MQESKYFQRQREKILREAAINYISAALKERFPADIVNALIPVIQNISDLQRLEELHTAAVRVPTIEAFAQMLSESQHTVGAVGFFIAARSASKTGNEFPLLGRQRCFLQNSLDAPILDSIISSAQLEEARTFCPGLDLQLGRISRNCDGVLVRIG